MKFQVFELPKAEADVRSIFEWLRQRSSRGAAAWLDAYDEMVARLEEHADSFGAALENPECNRDVRQALFKTHRGRVYRALFFLEGDRVYILRIRGPGQAPANPSDLPS